MSATRDKYLSTVNSVADTYEGNLYNAVKIATNTCSKRQTFNMQSFFADWIEQYQFSQGANIENILKLTSRRAQSATSDFAYMVATTTDPRNQIYFYGRKLKTDRTPSQYGLVAGSTPNLAHGFQITVQTANWIKFPLYVCKMETVVHIRFKFIE